MSLKVHLTKPLRLSINCSNEVHKTCTSSEFALAPYFASLKETLSFACQCGCHYEKVVKP